MSAIPGTNIADTIVPFDTNDTYATHDEMYGKGGWRSVQTITDRDLIPLERRTDRMVVNILDSGQVYQLKNGTSNSNWESFTIDVSGLDISINNIGPDINGNFNIIGSSSVLVSSNPLTNTILISAGDSVKTYLLPGYGIGITEDVENSYTISVTGSFDDASLRSEVEAITGNLQSQLLLQYNSINDIYSTYTNSATTSVISAGLSSRIDSIVIPDVSNFIATSEVDLISSGLNSRLTSNELLDTQQTNSINTLFSTYTNSATTQAISAGLSYRIDNISSSSISGNYLPISGGTLTGLVILKGVSNPGTASCNESFGSNALQNSSAMHNTAFGHRAGMSLTTGASNTLFGSSAGLNLVDSYGNVAIGYSAMGSANGTLAGSNTAIGTQALYSLTNGFSNIAIGSGAMTTSKLTAKENISIGQNSLNTSNGDSNVAIGSSAGFGMVGDRNIVIGKYAGYGNTGTDQLWIDSRDTIGTTSGSAFLYGEMTAGRLFIKGSRVATIDDVPSNFQGSQALDTSNILYTIYHAVLPTLSRYPIITLQVPTSASNLMVAAITNRTLSSFDVILSQSPNTSGYYINWSIVG